MPEAAAVTWRQQPLPPAACGPSTCCAGRSERGGPGGLPAPACTPCCSARTWPAQPARPPGSRTAMLRTGQQQAAASQQLRPQCVLNQSERQHLQWPQGFVRGAHWGAWPCIRSSAAATAAEVAMFKLGCQASWSSWPRSSSSATSALSSARHACHRPFSSPGTPRLQVETYSGLWRLLHC